MSTGGITTATGISATGASSSGGTVTAVTGSAGVISSGGNTPNLTLDESFPNVWTANQEISDAEPRFLFNETDAGTDLKLWDIDINGGVLTIRTRTDADGAGKIAIQLTRGTTTALSSINLGNATDLIAYNFFNNGAGNATFSGAVIAPRFTPNNTTIPGSQGIYQAAAGALGFGINGVKAGTVDASGISVSVAGTGLLVKEGSNAKQGTSTLVGGTVVVANTSVTANSRIFITAQSLGTVAVPSAYGVSARTAGTSFTILASAPTDTSVVAWEIFEPAA